MKVNRENYEIFFLDYYEGTLSRSKVEELMSFLEINPDLKEEFDMFELVGLDEDIDNLGFPNKESLKKKEIESFGGINQGNYIEQFIACHEGDLDENQKDELQGFLELNADLKEEFNLFSKSKLEPDMSVVFLSKNTLKHKSTISFSPVFMRYAASIAALMVIGFAVFRTLTTIQVDNNASLAFSSGRKGIDATKYVNWEAESEVIKVVPTHYYNTVSNISTKKERMPENIRYQNIPPSEISELSNANLHNTPPEFQTKRTEYAEIYAYRNIRLEAYDDERQNPVSIGESRFFNRVAETFGRPEDDSFDLNSKISGWQIAEYGVKGFNLLTDNDVDFRIKSNDRGDVTKVAFNDFAIPVKRDR